ncbi:MAG: hypothetical protein ACXWG3_18765 [Usitatibacter sp.]
MAIAHKPLSSYRLRSRFDSPWPGFPRTLRKPPLWEFVFLSMLLHAIAIALFGAPSGGSSQGRAMWGALQVVLQGAAVDAGPKLRMDQGLGAARPEEPRKRPRPAPRVAPQREEPAAPILKPEARIETIAPPVVAPPAKPAPVDVPVVVPPLLERITTPERKYDLPAFKVPLPTPVQAAPAPPPAPAAAEMPAVVERPAPRAERAPAEAPPVPAPLVQPRVERAVTEPAPVPAPMVQPLPPPPIPERIVAPPVESPPVPTPMIPAIPPMPMIQSAPLEVPVLAVPRIEPVAPPRVESAPRAIESAPVQSAPAPAPAPATTPRPAPSASDRPVIREEAAPRFNAPPGSPDSVLRGERAPSSNYDPTAPAVDVDAMKKRAGDLARSGSGQRAILPFPMPPVPEKKSKIEAALDKAHKPDCRTAYSSLGLAAVVPLIANEFGEGTCKW